MADVGRTAAWAPFFDDMDCIIFLAPISAFDQVLAEEPRVNRLVRLEPRFGYYVLIFRSQADSVNLWTTIVSNKLLANTNIILFLNKIDIMKSKLVRPTAFFGRRLFLTDLCRSPGSS